VNGLAPKRPHRRQARGQTRPASAAGFFGRPVCPPAIAGICHPRGRTPAGNERQTTGRGRAGARSLGRRPLPVESPPPPSGVGGASSPEFKSLRSSLRLLNGRRFESGVGRSSRASGRGVDRSKAVPPRKWGELGHRSGTPMVGAAFPSGSRRIHCYYKEVYREFANQPQHPGPQQSSATADQ